MSDLSFQMQSVSILKGSKFHYLKKYISEYPFFFEDISFINENDEDLFVSQLKEGFHNIEIMDFGKSLGTKIFKTDDFVLIMSSKSELEIILFLKDYNENTSKLSSILDPFVDNMNSSNIAINYFYSGGSEMTQQTILTKKSELLNVNKNMYPKINIDSLIEAYMKSSENILILMGPSGTGKTTLLKYILAKAPEFKKNSNKTNVYCKDELLLRSDGFWVSLLKKEVDFLLLDDIDNILHSRDEAKDGNPFVSQLLSFSNGVFSNSTKIVITTNKPLEDIDASLLRPGRCFDILNIDLLTRDEAFSICKNDYKLTKDMIYFDNDMVQQSDLIMKVSEKLDNNAKEYIFSEGVSQKEAFISGKKKKRAGFLTE